MNDGGRLAGKVALITGAARGIGLGIARRLASEGCQVVLNDIDETELSRATETLSNVVPISADVADEAEVTNMFGFIARNFGGPDILVNNAARVVGRRLRRLRAQGLRRRRAGGDAAGGGARHRFPLFDQGLRALFAERRADRR